MSLEDTIIAGVIFERAILTGNQVLTSDGADERLQIDHYGRKMIRAAKRGRIRPQDSDEKIAKLMTGGLWVWLFWQIAPELLAWVIAAVRKRIWERQHDAATGNR
jgi:hypothetical protein